MSDVAVWQALLANQISDVDHRRIWGEKINHLYLNWESFGKDAIVKTLTELHTQLCDLNGVEESFVERSVKEMVDALEGTILRVAGNLPSSRYGHITGEEIIDTLKDAKALMENFVPNAIYATEERKTQFLTWNGKSKLGPHFVACNKDFNHELIEALSTCTKELFGHNHVDANNLSGGEAMIYMWIVIIYYEQLCKHICHLEESHKHNMRATAYQGTSQFEKDMGVLVTHIFRQLQRIEAKEDMTREEIMKNGSITANLPKLMAQMALQRRG